MTHNKILRKVNVSLQDEAGIPLKGKKGEILIYHQHYRKSWNNVLYRDRGNQFGTL